MKWSKFVISSLKNYQKTGNLADILFGDYFARSIRNEYNLWDKENPYTFANETYTNNTAHPDNVSHKIMNRFIEYLNSNILDITKEITEKF